MGKDHEIEESKILDKVVFAFLILISKDALNPETSNQIESEFSLAYRLLQSRPNIFALIPIYTDLDHDDAMEYKDSWIRRNENGDYYKTFKKNVGLEAPTKISTWTSFERFGEWKQWVAENNPEVRNSFWENC